MMEENEIYHDPRDFYEESDEEYANFNDENFLSGFNGTPGTDNKSSYENDNDYSDSYEMQFLQNLAEENDMDVESFIEAFTHERLNSQIEEWEEEGYDDETIEFMLEEQQEEQEIRRELELMNRVHKEHFDRDFDPDVDEIHPSVFQLMEEYPDATLAQAYSAYCAIEGDTFLAGFNSI